MLYIQHFNNLPVCYSFKGMEGGRQAGRKGGRKERRERMRERKEGREGGKRERKSKSRGKERISFPELSHYKFQIFNFGQEKNHKV